VSRGAAIDLAARSPVWNNPRVTNRPWMPGSSDAESLYLNHRDLVEDAIGFVVRRHRLPPDEAEEIASLARLKLVEADGEVFRRFEGRSSLKTYLVAVVHRVVLDERVRRWGKWRPSAEARRLGPTAVALERAITRDGLTRQQAVTMVAVAGATEDASEVAAIAARLPARVTRRPASEEELEDVPAPGPSPEEQAMRGDLRASARHARDVLARAIADLPPRERLLVRLRFEDGLPVTAIARRIGGHPAEDSGAYLRVYRELGRAVRLLGAALAAAGVARDILQPALGDPVLAEELAGMLSGEPAQRGSGRLADDSGREAQGRGPSDSVRPAS
jgi:RNA polymerase sigma factor for flagellar operon FliA